MTCAQCKESIPKCKQSDHEQEYHKKEKCPYCQDPIDEQQLGLHKTVCPAKPKPCLYCGAIMELIYLIHHQEDCGNRTETCDYCGKNVTLKTFPEHIQTCIEDENDNLLEIKDYPLKRKKNSQSSGKKKAKK
jgi:hypothetical protein